MRVKLQELVIEMVQREIPLNLAKREFENAFLREVISRHGGNCSAAARQLGMHRNTLSKKIGQQSDVLRYHKMSCPDALTDPVA
ncbi:MAG: helix-turn-helix domain-containing protein [Holophagales bacterium]|jgi:ActR/RegA family two-component response regulator|nr:helix-turn-helix domain-containing protein [Holophagales bacterium]